MNLVGNHSAALPAALAMLEQQIVRRTWGRVRHLRVERVDGRIVVHGSAPSYYVKQLVLEAIRDLHSGAQPEPVRINIAVPSAQSSAPIGRLVVAVTGPSTSSR
jgi:hypothetical protein